MLLAWQNKCENHDAPQQILPARADTCTSSPRVGWGCLPLLEGPWTADRKHSPSWSKGFNGKTKQLQVSTGSAWEWQQPVSHLLHPLPRSRHMQQLARRDSPSANRCALRKGRNGARAREEKGHPSCNLTFQVCCLRKQIEMLQCLQCFVGKVVSQFFLH